VTTGRTLLIFVAAALGIACSNSSNGGVGLGSRADSGGDGRACVAACGSDATQTADAGREDGADADSLPPPNCTECEGAAASQGGACYGPATACMNDSSCTALVGCVSACTSSTCVDACRSSNAAGVTGYQAYSLCVCGGSCKALCASECVGIGETDAASTCSSCQVTATTIGGACFREAETCSASSTCVALLDCLNECPAGDTPCVTACDQAHVGGEDGVMAVDLCLCTSAACASECPEDCGKRSP
jgi:hypothetical protein